MAELSKLELEEISDYENNLVNKIIFYDSVRKGNSGKGRKDLVSMSQIKTKVGLRSNSPKSWMRAWLHC